jgi:hypothetical protein
MRFHFGLVPVACALLTACAGGGPLAIDQSLTADENELFDRLVTPASVFSNPSQRARYELQSTETEGGRRFYLFQLKPQPGMIEGQHFQLITISWARAGTSLARTESGAVRSSTGGPNGSFVDVAMRTGDGAFDVRVSEATHLPDAVQVPDVDLDQIAADLVKRYDGSASPRNSSLSPRDGRS